MTGIITAFGIDLAGSLKRPTGVCALRGMQANADILYDDADLLAYVSKVGPDIIAIDAPLTLPPGRKSIDDNNGLHFRLCDLELRKRRIPFFPITLGPMRTLTLRGIALRKALEARGITQKVIEVYPGGAQDIWGLPRQHRDLTALRRGLSKLGVKGLKSEMTGDELDAVTCALVGRLFLQGQAEVYGSWSEGAIVMPISHRQAPI